MTSSLSEQVKTVLTELSEPTETMVPFTAERRAQEIGRVMELAQIRWLVSLADIDARRVPEALGYTSTERYVAYTQQTTARQASEYTKISRLIGNSDAAKKALLEGLFGLGHAGLLAKAAARFGDQYTIDEGRLLEIASRQTLDRFSDTIARWIHAADLDAAEADTAHRYNTRGLWIQQRLDGSGTGRFDLDAIAFATVAVTLDSVAGQPDPKHSLNQRSLAQRRADALAEMALAYGPEEDESGSDVEPLEPHGRRQGGAVIEAVVSLSLPSSSGVGRDYSMADQLPEIEDGLSDLWATGPVPYPIIEQLSCDASWRRILDGPSQKLDYSSPTADITPNQRRAIRYRDRHCQFQGCDRPWNWCDVHHIVSRHDGGPTTLNNLTLMCRHHHTLLHQAGWSFTRDPITGETRTTSP